MSIPLFQPELKGMKRGQSCFMGLQFKRCLSGHKEKGIVGVVASGNLEVLLERTTHGSEYEVEINITVRGFDELWHAVITDFIERASPGGLKISINDGGARPDTVRRAVAYAVASDGEQGIPQGPAQARVAREATE